MKTDKSKAINVINWLVGVVLCSLGVCFCTRAGFGLSMIAAPPYILFAFFKQYLPWYTQGTSEYIWQAFLMLVTCIAILKFKPKFILSFLTAVIAGLTIDGWFVIIGGNTVYDSMPARIIAFVGGTLITTLAIAFVFRTTMPVQVYELLVMEISDRYSFDRNRVKLINDITMLVLSVVLSAVLLGSVVGTGVGIGTIITTFVNAPLIKLWGKFIDKIEG